jgi:hypothetical protein
MAAAIDAEADVEARGVREKALVFTVAAVSGAAEPGVRRDWFERERGRVVAGPERRRQRGSEPLPFPLRAEACPARSLACRSASAFAASTSLSARRSSASASSGNVP